MKKTIFLVVMATLCLFFRVRVHAQVLIPEYTERALTIGDKVPDMEFNTVYNYKSSTLKLSDFKGKAILLDFWATWCSGCVSALPKIEAFKKKYGKNLVVLMYDNSTRDTPEVINHFLSERKAGKMEVSLPLILHSASIKSVFPNRAIPHYVWISADRRVKAITGYEELSEENVIRLVSGLDLDLPIKNN